MDTIFKYQLEHPGRLSNDVTKCCTFYIHVEVVNPAWFTNLEHAAAGMYHYIELMHNFSDFLPDLLYRNPSRLTYYIQYYEMARVFKVIQKLILGCIDHHSLVTHIKEKCRFDEASQQFRVCAHKVQNAYIVNTNAVQ